MQSDVQYRAFSPILLGRSFDGTRDKWTARRGAAREASASALLAASPLKCNVLFVTELALDEKFGH